MREDSDMETSDAGGFAGDIRVLFVSLLIDRCLPVFVATMTIICMCMLTAGCEEADEGEDTEVETEESTTIVEDSPGDDNGPTAEDADETDLGSGSGSVMNTAESSLALEVRYRDLDEYETNNTPPEVTEDSSDEEVDIVIDGG